jgi:hypothetical protein
MTPFTQSTEATGIDSRRFGFGCIVVALAIATVACSSSSSTTSTGPSPVKCQVALTASLNSIGASGGTGTITVATQPECAWTVTAEVNWISDVTPTSGQGNGQVQFKVGENQVNTGRAGDIVINDNRIRLQQEAAACRFDVSPTSHTFASSGGGGEVTVNTPTGCAWTASTEASWISITSGTTGNGTGGLRFNVAANAGAARSGSLVVAGQQSVVSQANGAPTPGCAYVLTASAATIPATGGPGSVTLNTAATCNWSAASNAPWITLTSAPSGNGNATISFSVAANSGGERSGTLTIGGQIFTVTQSGAPPAGPGPPPCTFAINPTSQTIGAGGGAGTAVALTTATGCAWTAASNAPWITLTSAASGSGNATVNFSVGANSGGARDGTLTIGGQIFTVTQSGAAGPAPCTYSINPTSQSLGPGAGTGTVAVGSAGGCSWTAVSNASWITITSGSTGSGNGTVGFSVAANSGGTRTGTLTIAGATFSLTQGECAYQINPNNQSIGASGGPGTQVAVSTTSGCTWTATSNASWITVTSGASGNGNGTVNFNVAPNTGSSTRTGTLTIAGRTFTVSQDRLVCDYNISPNSESFEEQGGNGEPIAVSANPGCAWTATSSVPWITITSGLSGVGDGTVRFRVDRNHGNQRTGTMIIAGKTFTVSQEEDED